MQLYLLACAAATFLDNLLILRAAVLACNKPLPLARAIFTSASLSNNFTVLISSARSSAVKIFLTAVLIDVLRARFTFLLTSALFAAFLACFKFAIQITFYLFR